MVRNYDLGCFADTGDRTGEALAFAEEILANAILSEAWETALREDACRTMRDEAASENARFDALVATEREKELTTLNAAYIAGQAAVGLGTFIAFTHATDEATNSNQFPESA